MSPETANKNGERAGEEHILEETLETLYIQSQGKKSGRHKLNLKNT